MAKKMASYTGSVPVIEQGEKGDRGPIMRQHRQAVSGSYTYLQGKEGERYIDLLLSGGKWYMCTSTYTTASPSVTDGHWQVASNFDFVATDLVLASKGFIDNLQVDDILITSEGGGNGEVMLKADKNGIVCNQGTFKNVNVSGEITATSGSIGGFIIEKNNLISEESYIKVGSGNQNSEGKRVITDTTSLTLGASSFCQSIENINGSGLISSYIGGLYIDVASTSGILPQMASALYIRRGQVCGLRTYVLSTFVSLDFSSGTSVPLPGVGMSAYQSGMFLVFSNSSEVTLTLPYSPVAQAGDFFTVIKAGRGSVKIKGKTNYYYAANGSNGEFTTTSMYEHTHLFFDGTTWYSECSKDS